MPGGLMTARREAALRIRFDERLSGYGLCEDEDFSYRLSRGGRLRYLPRATVAHRNVGAGEKLGDSREFNRMVVVNRAYLFRKNFRRTARARLGFAMLVGVLAVPRAVNGAPAGALGLLHGSLAARRHARGRGQARLLGGRGGRTLGRAPLRPGRGRERGRDRDVRGLRRHAGACGPQRDPAGRRGPRGGEAPGARAARWVARGGGGRAR